MRALWLLLFTTTAHATLVPPPDLGRRIEEADTIVVATLRSGTLSYSGNRVSNDLTLHVDRVLKGSAIPNTLITASLEGHASFIYPQPSVSDPPKFRAIWLLKREGTVNRIIPRQTDFGELDLAVVPLPISALAGQIT